MKRHWSFPSSLGPLAIILFVLLASSTGHALTPRHAVAKALVDLDQINKDDQPFQRYLFMPGEPAPIAEILEFAPALRLHVNLISRESQLAYPRVVHAGLWRVDLRDYQWSRDTWESLANIDPYYHRVETVLVSREKTVTVTRVVTEKVLEPIPGYGYREVLRHREVKEQTTALVKVRETKRILYVPNGAAQMAALALLADSQAPIVRADWFLVQGARQISLTNRQTGAGYYDWLGLKSLDDYNRLIGENARQAIQSQQIIRAVVGDSGVTQNNRLVEITGCTTGRHYTTFEVEDQSGRGIAIQNLRQGELVAAASEHYAPLPNGLPATFLNSIAGNKTERQDAVPDKIAANRSVLNVGNDLRVHVNLACIQCHAGAVLQPIEDDVRPVYTGRLSTTSNDKFLDLELRRQYGASLNRVVDRDRDDYQSVFTQVTGLKPAEAAATYSRAFTHYAYTRVTVHQAARELGVPTAGLVKALQDAAQRRGFGDFRFDPFLLDVPRPISRLNFEDAFADVQDLLYGILDAIPAREKQQTPGENP